MSIESEIGEIVDSVSNGELVYEDLIARGKAEYTARAWRAWVKEFEGICGVKGEYERRDVVKFLAWLREHGRKQNSINTIMRSVKLLSVIQGWDYPKLAMPRVRGSDINRPCFSCDDVKRLIEMACMLCDKKVEVSRRVTERELAFLAFSLRQLLPSGAKHLP